MKKFISMLLIFALCAGLCACGGGEDVELPTKPVPIAVPTRPAPEEAQSGTDAAEESTEAIDPTGETYPWEAEFNEDDYSKFEITAPKGEKIVTWREGSIFGTERRNLYEWTDGNIEDSYYYPSGNCSHSYMWYADGKYVETYYLDDGYIDLEKKMTVSGTVVYSKQIDPDGSTFERFDVKNGIPTRTTFTGSDGSYGESSYFENGNVSKSVYGNSATGEYQEQEYYENGNFKYCKYTTPEYTSEERYDEEGFRTYYYVKGVDWEQECIADENGKLVKVIENGTEIQDPAIIARYAKDYNFRE